MSEMDCSISEIGRWTSEMDQSILEMECRMFEMDWPMFKIGHRMSGIDRSVPDMDRSSARRKFRRGVTDGRACGSECNVTGWPNRRTFPVSAGSGRSLRMNRPRGGERWMTRGGFGGIRSSTRVARWP